jgi:peptidase E
VPIDHSGPVPAGRRTILALGGHEFSRKRGNEAIRDYMLALADGPEPRVCLLPTASGDPADQIAAFRASLRGRPCTLSHVSLFRLEDETVDIAAHLLSQDLIYVGGGSMLNLLAVWRAHGFDAILREAWEAGVALAGLSAGSMCWFEWGITTSTGAPAPAEGLGWLPGSNTVHYDGEPARRPVFLAAVASGAVPGGFAVDDGVGLRFAGTELVEAVSSQAGGRAFRVERDGDEAVETPLAVRHLGDATGRERQVPADIAEWRALRERRAFG